MTDINKKEVTTVKEDSSESEFLIEGMAEATKKVNELAGKLREARTIANELASIEIVINDKRQKDLVEYVGELRREFTNHAGYEPHGYYLVAEGHSFELRIGLNL